MTRCVYCNARLSKAESVRRGYGRDCAIEHGQPYGRELVARGSRRRPRFMLGHSGELVELQEHEPGWVPPWQLVGDEVRARPCVRCGALGGEPCLDRSGSPQGFFHRERL